MNIDLIEKIKKNKCVISVIGLGRVGLPLAALYAENGINVVGIDINEERVNAIRKGKVPFYDPELQRVLEKAINSKKLSVETSLKNIDKKIDIIFVTVGTPTVDNSIDYSQLYSALNEISQIEIRDKIIVLRSTLPPGTTNEIVIPFFENKFNLKVGKDFGVVVCPERILEGKAIKELKSLPEIIGTNDEECRVAMTNILKILSPEKEFLYTSSAGAELSKLFANIYRYINFALSNEFAIWAERYGLDAGELIKIVNYKYDRCNIPRPGFVGGPCLSKDGTFLDNNTTFSSIVSAAWKLNESIPQHIINNIKKITGPLFNKNISVLGLSFKSGSDDLRNSPSLKLVEILKSTGANILVHDPHIGNTATLEEVLNSPEIVIVATNHSEFNNITSKIDNCGCKIIFDVWGIYQKDKFQNVRYLKFGDAA